MTGDSATAVREPRLTTEAEVSRAIQDGMTIAVGGFINAAHPMSLVRRIIADRKKDLTVVGAASAGLEIDLLISGGCVRKVVTPYVGAEGLVGIGPAFRHAAQQGLIETFDLDEAHFYAGLRAAAQRLPFNPWRAGVGTSFPIINPALREFRDPVRNELLLAIPAIDIDVCLLHAARSDVYGNVQHNGTRYGDVAMYGAAELTFVSVEEIVSPERIRANPAATSIPGADGIIRAPFGCHPFSSDGYYVPDIDHLEDFIAATSQWLKTGSRTRLDEYLNTYVYEAKDHIDYLERIGMRALLGLAEV